MRNMLDMLLRTSPWTIVVGGFGVKFALDVEATDGMTLYGLLPLVLPESLLFASNEYLAA